MKTLFFVFFFVPSLCLGMMRSPMREPYRRSAHTAEPLKVLRVGGVFPKEQILELTQEFVWDYNKGSRLTQEEKRRLMDLAEYASKLDDLDDA